MDNNIPWSKLGRYVLGQSSKQEEKEIESWIAEHPERQNLVDELNEIWDNSTQHTQQWDIDVAWSKFSEEVSDKQQQHSLRLAELKRDKSTQRRIQYSASGKWRTGRKAITYAAAAAVMLLAIIWYLPHKQEKTSEQLVMQEIVAKKGQQSQFQLSDGSKVWLNAESKLKIPAHFTSDVREVYLKGEAFFKVKSNTDKPFLVHTGNSVTKVLGTRFNVRAYDEDIVQVVVEEGRVALGADIKSMSRAPELSRNQMGTLEEDGEIITSEINDMRPYTSWRNGELVFKDTPLSKVLPTLERWYDINCTIADSALVNRTVTASFKGESMVDVVRIISLSVGMEFQREKRNIRFYQKPI